MMTEIHTQVNIGSLMMKNPVMPASGAYDYFEDNANTFPMSELGAIMLKTIHHDYRPGNKPPRVAEVTGGMINSIGIPSVGIHAFVESRALEEKYSTLNVPVIVSVSGGSAADIAECCTLLEGSPYVAALELNLSCPNVGTGLQLSSEENVLAEVIQAARRATARTFFAKLSPNVTNIARMAKICEDNGADAVTVANTYMGMKIDLNTRKPFLGNGQGGVSGPAIKPLTLYKVFQVYKAVKIPVIGCGGIMNTEDALEYIFAGASAVQVGAANFADPNAMIKIIRGLEAWMKENQVRDLSEICGAAHG